MESLAEGLFGNRALFEHVGVVALLVAARWAPVLVVVPWLGVKKTPALVRASLLLVCTFVMMPTALAHASAELGLSRLVPALFARELMVGLTFGLATAAPFFALDWAGQLADSWRGASMSTVLAPGSGEQTSPLGAFYLLLGVTLFFAVGGHRFALEAFADGIIALPPGGTLTAEDARTMAMGTAQLLSQALRFAAAVAAPAAACVILAEMTLGLLGRAAPQIPIYFVGMPARSALALVGLLLSLGLLLEHLPGAFSRAMQETLRMLQAIST